MDNSTSEINQTEINTGVEQPQPEQPRKSKILLYGTLAIAVILLIGSAVTFYIYKNNADDEEMAYSVLENNENPQDYKDFLEKYPSSERTAEVKERLEKLEQMIRAWNGIALSDNTDDFEKFKTMYESTHYAHLCDIKIDSLDFVTASRLSTPEAYQDYLTAHPDGRYASEASIAQGNLKNMEVSAEEQANMVRVITEFFEGFGAKDETMICSNITASMNVFLSHKNVTKAQVVSIINSMFNEHIQNCNFVVNRDIKISRLPGGNAGYAAVFTVDQHIERDNEGKTFDSYECKLEMTPQLLINALTLEKISVQE